jgi:rare lipoprotein A (peptidoglycan hydrolase)
MVPTRKFGALGVRLITLPGFRCCISLVMGSLGCSQSVAERPAVFQASRRPVLLRQKGQAVLYGDSLAGKPTASGEPHNPRAFTAAHRTLPFGSVVRVSRTDEPLSVTVRINDRGPFGDPHRIIDLSRAAAERLGMQKRGIAPVVIEVLEYPSPRGRARKPSNGPDT